MFCKEPDTHRTKVFAFGERVQRAPNTVATIVGTVVAYPVNVYGVELDCEELDNGRDGDTTNRERRIFSVNILDPRKRKGSPCDGCRENAMDVGQYQK
jgi:hypothetical protein